MHLGYQRGVFGHKFPNFTDCLRYICACDWCREISVTPGKAHILAQKYGLYIFEKPPFSVILWAFLASN